MPSGDQEGVSRRLLMKSVAGLGVTAGFTGLSAAESDGTHVLGEFENGLDGWRTNGGVDLSRVTETDVPGAVEKGDHALAVDPAGDAYPVIENESRVEGNSFVETPYLIGRVRTSFSERRTDLTLVLRYHHGDTPADGAGENTGGSKSGKPGNRGSGKPVLVEEKTLDVPFGARSTIAWDLSDLSDRKLRTPKRLEIGWYVGDTPPSRGPRGKQNRGESPGTVYFDAIRMTGSRDRVDKAAMSNQIDGLLARHGDYAYETREFFDGGERGVFVFHDGTEVPVEWEDLGPDKERYTIDGTTYRLGGDWE